MVISSSRNTRNIFLVLGILLTIVLFAITAWVRLEEGSPSLGGFEWQEISLDSDVLGLALQELFVPLVGLYLFSGIPLFERIVTAASIQKADRIKLISILALILLLSVMATGWFNEDYDALVTNGMLIVLAAGLLGGWRTGIVLGSAAMFFYLAFSFLLELPLDQIESISKILFDLQNELLWNLLEFSVLAMLWGGIIIGFWRDAVGAQVWMLSRLFVVGLLLEWFPAWLDFIATGEVEDVLEHLPAALITGFLLMVFGLLVRQAQGRFTEKQLTSSKHARTQAELKALRAQINPHFLFNALSTIRYHARTNPDTAYELLDDLSDVFRSALNSDAFVALDDELEMVKSYLAIEQARLGERLNVIWKIDKSVDQEQPVPALMIQPLVENAVVHGIAPKPSGGTVSINVQNDVNHILIQITDDGDGFDIENMQPKGTGIGMANVKERLISIYGLEYAPKFDSRDGQGTQISIRIPR